MEKPKSVRTQSDEVWAEIDPLQNDNAKVFLEVILEHQKESSKVYSNAYYIILILTAVYWILIYGSVQELTFLSIKVSNIDILKWVIPVIMSFLFYQGTCAFILEIYLADVSDSYLEKYLPKVYSGASSSQFRYRPKMEKIGP